MLIKFNEYNILINNDANNNINNLMNNLSNDNIDIQLDNVSTIIFNQFNMLDDYHKTRNSSNFFLKTGIFWKNWNYFRFFNFEKKILF